MSIKSIRTGWTGISALAGNDQWFSDFESIASVTVGAGGQSTITFSNIPSTYKHLQIRCIARDDQGSGINNEIMRFNSDSGSNYSQHYLLGNGSAASSGAGTNQTSISTAIYVTSAGSGANRFAATIIDILDYADTNKYKTTRSLTGGDDNGSGVILLTSGSWRSTSAVTTITFPAGGTFQQNSHFALYGIRG